MPEDDSEVRNIKERLQDESADVRVSMDGQSLQTKKSIMNGNILSERSINDPQVAAPNNQADSPKPPSASQIFLT